MGAAVGGASKRKGSQAAMDKLDYPNEVLQAG